MVRAAVAARELEHGRDAWLAWHIGHLVSVGVNDPKKFPTFKKFMAPAEEAKKKRVRRKPKAKAPPWQQMLSMARQWTAAMPKD